MYIRICSDKNLSFKFWPFTYWFCEGCFTSLCCPLLCNFYNPLIKKYLLDHSYVFSICTLEHFTSASSLTVGIIIILIVYYDSYCNKVGQNMKVN